MVQVISEDGRQLAIELVKKNWDDVVRSGKTKDGKFESSFKTAMEFGIIISAKEKGIPFIVAVSAGTELFPPSNLFVDASTMRPSTAKDAVDLAKDESGESNNLLYIIIAAALVGILVLLAILVFKKKGKGTASMILFFLFSISAEAGLVQNLGNSLSGKATAGLANFFIDSMGKRYGRGDFSGDDPLDNDDETYEPELDPRGQPSLPSSCYEIARMGRSGSSGGDAGKGFSGAKNPTNEDGGIPQTMSTGGGSINGETSTNSSNGKDNDVDLSVEQQVENATKELERDRRETLNSFDIGLRQQMQNYENILQGTRENYQEQKIQAEGDPERQRNLADELIAREKELGEMNVARIEELKTIRDNNLELVNKFYNERLLEIMRRANEREGEQPNNEGGEKDPDRERDKGNPAKGGPSPQSAPGDSPNPQSERDKEKEAGCKCLEEAYANLQKRRYSLEKLLKIGQHTKKVTDYGISFGDDFSGVHGVSGLAWQKQRAEILKSIDQFDVTYTNKYNELIDRLYDTLIQIDECELKLGYENWYSQSGFIYYEFMKVRYASYK
ncbi:hypothetical protein [Yeosuana marina]|uniref:hypothetical protein n=1 Tax=Yeosuana marina TaxID=1565536 RepID=UPI0030EEB6ED